MLTASNAVQGSSATLTTTYNVTADDVLTFNPVIALYTNPSDPTTPLELEACPKLELPLPDSGLPYPSLADAQNILDSYVSNCVGYSIINGVSGASFTATDGGSTLTLDGSLSASYTNNFSCPATIGTEFAMVGSVSMSANTVLHCSYSVGGDYTLNGSSFVSRFFVRFLIYDQDGQFFAFDSITLPASGGSGTKDYSITKAGKYTVITSVAIGADCVSPFGLFSYTLNGNIVFSSDDIMTVNPAQALYTNGSNCPSRLDCTP